MDRKATTKGEMSRARLLKAAMQQFADKGFHAAKVSDIVKAAGLTQAAFYLYFPSKDAIFTELVEEYKQRLAELSNAGSLVTPLESSAVPDQVRENLRNLLSFVSASPELTRIALFESSEAEQIEAGILQLITRNLRNNQQAGHVRPDLPLEVAAESMMAIVERFILKLLQGKTDLDSLVDDMANVICFGILSPQVGRKSCK